jgi:pimeloyl-ACP methyl ester carboxylesterase
VAGVSARRAATAATLIAVIAGAGLANGAEPQERRGATASAVDLGACPEKVRPKRLRCGTLRVPLERGDPSLGKIPIRFAVRAPTDRSKPRLGTIFAVEGGPGYGSIASTKYYIHMLGPLLERRELVTVDMRGTGHSRAIDCPDLQEGRGTDAQGVAQCAQLLGDTFASYRTSAAADDLDAVRSALGRDRISMYGDSYGTFLAQSYAYRHGFRLESLILDGAYPVRGESGWYPSLTRTGIRSLEISCRRSNRCSGPARKRLAQVVELLRDTRRGAGPLLTTIGSSGYEPPRRYYMKVNDAVSAYLAGDTEPMRKLTKVGKGGFGSYRSYSRGLELAVSCNDYSMLWKKSADRATRKAQQRTAIRTYPSDRFFPFTPREVALESFSTYPMCIEWPQPNKLYEPPAPAGRKAPKVPTLVISGELDDVTSATEGAAVARAFPRSTFRVVRNAGHIPSLYGGRYPARDWVRRFVERHG